MYIVKDVNDFKLTPKQTVFLDFIRENIGSYSCHEKIKNTDYIRHYSSPRNEFLVYTNSMPYAQVHRLRVNQKKAH